MSQLESCLPEHWVAKIFAAMRATYGAEFDRQWECPAGVDAKEHAASLLGFWSRALGIFAGDPKAIRFALDNLPERVPNLQQFIVLCRRKPAPAFKALPNNAKAKAAPEVAEKLAQIGRAGIGKTGHISWAVKLQEREFGGVKLSRLQREAWRQALGVSA